MTTDRERKSRGTEGSREGKSRSGKDKIAGTTKKE